MQSAAAFTLEPCSGKTEGTERQNPCTEQAFEYASVMLALIEFQLRHAAPQHFDRDGVAALESGQLGGVFDCLEILLDALAVYHRVIVDDRDVAAR